MVDQHQALLQDIRVTLNAHNCMPPVEIARFSALFQRVWHMIPTAGQEIISQHIIGGYVTLTNDISALVPKESPEVTEQINGCYLDDEKGFYFVSSKLAQMPDHIAETLIAHELAHAFCYATPDIHEGHAHARQHPEELNDRNGHSDVYMECDWKEVPEQMQEWGYDDKVLSEYNSEKTLGAGL